MVEGDAYLINASRAVSPFGSLKSEKILSCFITQGGIGTNTEQEACT